MSYTETMHHFEFYILFYGSNHLDTRSQFGIGIKRLLNARKSPNELLCKYHFMNISWHMILLTVPIVIGCTHENAERGLCDFQ